MTSTTARPTTATAALVGGGVITVIGTLLEWFSLTTNTVDAESVKGTDFSVGLGVLLFGVLLALAGLLVWVRSSKGVGRGWAIAGIVFAAIVVIVAAWTALAPESALPQFAASDISEQLGVSEAVATEAIKSAIAQGLLSASSGIGAWVSLVGGLAGLAGGILALGAIPKARMAATPSTGAVPPAPPV